ncbi:MAG: formyltransferase family protein [Pseudolysinimonas sp.]|uniref:methionyl-tRNA formyltransferase n=1 Tax=Pseudolysinimonas sp. TaxID=2680009 RepID=UPI003C77D21D
MGLIGRTAWLLDTAHLVLERGHEISFICTAPSSPEARAGVTEFQAFASTHGTPFFADPRISGLDLTADVCLSVNWVTVLRQPFLERFAHGVFNAHPGDLPRFRGNACLNWAILAGESEAVLTVHRMVEELDAGPIALKRRRPIAPEDDISTLYAWLDEQIPAALVETLDRVVDGTLELRPQDPSIRPLRVYPRKPEDSRINWGDTAERILRLVRASAAPFGGALTRLESGEEIAIHRARVHVPDHDFLAVPGQVCYAVDGNPIIATGDGMLELVELADDVASKQIILRSLRNRLV